MRRLFEGDTYSSLITVIGNLRVYQIQGKLLLHLGQNVTTFWTLLHLGSFITFRPSTTLAEHLQAHVKFRKMLEFKHYPSNNSRGSGPLAGLAGLAWKASERIRLQHGTYGKKKFFGRELDFINKFRNEPPKGASLR